MEWPIAALAYETQSAAVSQNVEDVLQLPVFQRASPKDPPRASRIRSVDTCTTRHVLSSLFALGSWASRWWVVHGERRDGRQRRG